MSVVKMLRGSISVLIVCMSFSLICAHPMGGVSLGGAAHTYSKPHLQNSLLNIQNAWVRLEGFPGDYEVQNAKSHAFRDLIDTALLAKEIMAMKAKGNRIVANVFYMPKALSSCPNGPDYRMCAPRDYQEWEQLLRDAVYWLNGRHELRIEYWEIANEPSGGHFFQQWSSGGFWDYFFRTARAIKDADNTAKVGGIGDNAMFLEHYEMLLKLCVSYGFKLDFLSVHWHGFWDGQATSNPVVFLEFSKRIDVLSRSILGVSLPVLWTEWSHSVDYPTTNVALLSAYIGQSIYYMNVSGNVIGANYFRVEPYAPHGGASSETVLDENNKMQTAGRILSFVNEMQGTPMYLSRPAPRNTVSMVYRTDTTLHVMYACLGGQPIKYASNIFAYIGWNRVERSMFIEDSSNASRKGTLLPVKKDTLDASAFVNQSLELPGTGVWMGRYRRLK